MGTLFGFVLFVEEEEELPFHPLPRRLDSVATDFLRVGQVHPSQRHECVEGTRKRNTNRIYHRMNHSLL
jgi:hypothetical protein